MSCRRDLRVKLAHRGAALLASSLLLRHAYAAPEPSTETVADAGPRAEAPRRLCVSVVGEAAPDLARELELLLRGRLPSEGWEPQVATYQARSPALAGEEEATTACELSVVLDTTGESGWELLLVDARHQRALRRFLEGGDAKDLAALEAVLSIIASASAALDQGDAAGFAPLERVLAPEAGPEPTKAPPAPPHRSAPQAAAPPQVAARVRAPTPAHLDLRLTGALRTLGQDAYTLVGGVGCVLVVPGSLLGVRLGLLAAASPTTRVPTPLGRLYVDELSFGLLAGVELPLRRDVLLTTELVLAATRVTRRTESALDEVTGVSSASQWGPVLDLSTGLLWQVTPRLAPFAAAGFGLRAKSIRYQDSAGVDVFQTDPAFISGQLGLLLRFDL